MYKVDVPVNDCELKAVERRRSAEVERRTRIFNPRVRVIGVDLPSLNRQVQEKRERLEMEKQRDMAHDLLRLSLDEMAMQQKNEEEQLRRELNMDLVQYRAIYQRPEESRDADINYNREGAPDVNISALGPSSMQVFQGEGINEKEKMRAQMEMNERNIRAQIEEKEKQERMHKNKEMLTGRELVENDLKAMQLDALKEECRRAERIALSHYNQIQAEERNERKRQEKLRREGEELAEIQYMVTSDLLTERPDAAKRMTEGSQVHPDRWKGMTPRQLGNIHKERERQCFEKERWRETERERELAWDNHLMEQSRQQEREEKRGRELERERKIQLEKYNRQLAREQQAHQQYLDKQLYTNRPGVEYFTKFNRSSR
ncbi:RIB43A-like with coiled-coils protein 1 [Paramisgurnus dabryanus]|uniref:RIB43A-like with coiled-coils protein 1 n=1 Tax=Paramisgurnus dabryanus TaxID=90735 RepID=UPI0031F44FEF